MWLICRKAMWWFAHGFSIPELKYIYIKNDFCIILKETIDTCDICNSFIYFYGAAFLLLRCWCALGFFLLCISCFPVLSHPVLSFLVLLPFSPV